MLATATSRSAAPTAPTETPVLPAPPTPSTQPEGPERVPTTPLKPAERPGTDAPGEPIPGQCPIRKPTRTDDTGHPDPLGKYM